MTKQQLNGTNIAAGLEQMDGKRMSKRMRSNWLGEAGETMRHLAGEFDGVPRDRLTRIAAGK